MRWRDFIRGSNGEGEAVRAIITEARNIGDMSIVTDSVLNFPPKFIATTGTLDTITGLINPETETVMFCHLDGSIIMIDAFAPGYSDVGNLLDQVIILKPTTAWADAVADSLNSLIISSDTAPASPADGDFWLDTSTSGGTAVDTNSVQTLLNKVINGANNQISAIDPLQVLASIKTTSGTNGSYVQIGSLLICFGTDTVANAGTNVTFGKAFAARPVVVTTIYDMNNQTAWCAAATTTYATLKQIYTSPLTVNWIAIGVSS